MNCLLLKFQNLEEQFVTIVTVTPASLSTDFFFTKKLFPIVWIWAFHGKMLIARVLFLFSGQSYSTVQQFVNYKWFSQHKWLRFLLLMSICGPRWNFCNEIFYKRNILIKFFLGIYFLIQDNFHSNLNKRKFIPWESFCFSWMFWKLILQKRAWVNKTARMSVSWWWQMQTTHKIHR